MTTVQLTTIVDGSWLADYSSQAVVEQVATSPLWAGAARYCKPTNPGIAKWLTPVERDRLHAAGKAIVLVYESFQTRPLAGYAAGVADAVAAADFAVGLDYPVGGSIMAAVDINTIAAGAGSNVTRVHEYLLGFIRTIDSGSPFGPGVYGDYEAIDAAGPLSVLNWQMGSRSFSGSRIHPAAHLLQYPESWVGHGLDHYDGPHSTAGIDSNLCLRPFVAWLPHVVADPKPIPPKPQPAPGDENMYLAILSDGTVVVVGSGVRPVSAEEIKAGGPLVGLPNYTPDPGSYWHAWLAAAAAEYGRRVGIG